jgi:hypothetical protein
MTVSSLVAPDTDIKRSADKTHQWACRDSWHDDALWELLPLA